MKNIILILTCLVVNIAFAQQETTTIYLIRHAEKADGSADPSLSAAGLERAKKWGKYFEDKNIDTYYHTKYKRTIETASYTSAHSMPKEGAPGTTYNRKFRSYEPMTLSLKQVAEENKGKSVVIVGHSNTIPTLVNNLIGERKYADIPESDFGNLYIVTITGDKVTHELVKM